MLPHYATVSVGMSVGAVGVSIGLGDEHDLRVCPILGVAYSIPEAQTSGFNKGFQKKNCVKIFGGVQLQYHIT
jgi:hypothetical protein